MDKQDILAMVDHTLLKQTATWDDIRKICDEAIENHTASVCIPPCYVSQASRHMKGQMKVCTVIGFPNGYSTTAVKVYETEDAIRNGAEEIDMVVNINWVKDGRYQEVKEEIQAVHKVCQGKILKVIIETCLLTEEEKLSMCEIVTEAGAEFIKTSTGFSTGGATADDVSLLRNNVGEDVKVKAAGGIATVADAEEFIELGAERLGTSRLIALLK